MVAYVFLGLCLFHPIHLIYWHTILFISIWSEVRSDNLCLLIRLNLFIFYDTIDIFGFTFDILFHFLYVLFIPLFLSFLLSIFNQYFHFFTHFFILFLSGFFFMSTRGSAVYILTYFKKPTPVYLFVI